MKSHCLGFTLLELAVALTIAGIAFAVTVPGVGGWISNEWVSLSTNL